jgi:hypothetical protein
MNVVVLQPSYLPWLGYLDQYAWCDRFVVYDDVQFDKGGWRNRNRVLTAQGPVWLTVPVLLGGSGFPLIREVRVDRRQPWRRKHLETIRQAYSRAPFFDWLYPDLTAYYAQDWPLLLDWDVSGLRLLTSKLGLAWKGVLASELPAAGRRTERLVAICSVLGATEYLTGDAARAYLDEAAFAARGVTVRWHGYQHPVYPQRAEPFTPYLSVVDLLFWKGPNSLETLWQTK